MGSKLKMKAPKKNRVLECDNQMSQAFARAMQNSRKELEVMQDQAYNDGFNTGDDWANTINSVTMMLALRKLHGYPKHGIDHHADLLISLVRRLPVSMGSRFLSAAPFLPLAAA